MTSLSSGLDRIFDSLLLREREDLAGPPPRPLPPEVERRVGEALCLFAEERYSQCRTALGDALAHVDSDPRVAALDAACRGLVAGRVRPAQQLCLKLLEKQAYLPDLYAILGVLFLKSKRRAEAYAAFRAGLRMAPEHPILRAGLERMGVRSAPVLRFLVRSHAANRWLGRLRGWMRPGDRDNHL